MIRIRVPNNWCTKIIIIAAIVGALAIYFYFELKFFPNFLLSNFSESQAKPIISSVRFPSSGVELAKPFRVSITASNQGDSADIQLVSISFPNLTNTKEAVTVLNYNFTQSPLLVQKEEEIGSSYKGLDDVIQAEYPSIQFYSRPWKSGASYNAQVEINPPMTGKFTVLIKTVALPHINSLSHFPQSGLKDFQQEYVSAYSVNVHEP
ncbi:MAG TPA: hypothetical protein VH415_09915 [Nitrososphaeraceae archaeon]|jgi:hypothetical protein